MMERLHSGCTKHSAAASADTSHCCGCSEHGASGTLRESLPEMDFQRSLAGAAHAGEIDKVETLLRKGADVNAEHDAAAGGYAPLHYAARQGHWEACRVLLQHGADVNRRTRGGQSTSLQRAAYAGHDRVVKLLLQKGADPLAVDSDGHTALSKAELQGHREIVDILKSAMSKNTQAHLDEARI